MPKTTDLGHHMYWSNHIIEFSSLPNFGIPDFIIGEHIIFAAISLISGISLISAMPVIVLLLINIFSLFSIFILAYRLAEILFGKKHAKKISLICFFIAGTQYAISSPEAKFVSGGVVGNIIGNFLIPLSLYTLLMIFKTRKPFFSQIFLILSATLVYTHHLSTFIFIYIILSSFFVSVIILLVKNKANIKKTYKKIFHHISPFFSPGVLATFLLILLFILFIRTPSYLNTSAIDTAVGVPFKETRTGLSVNSIINSAGSWKFLFGTVGSLFVAAYIFYKNNTKVILFGSVLLSWVFIIFMMSWKPSILRIDIPSNRIVSYITLPFSILSSIGIYLLLFKSKKTISKYLYILFFIVLFTTGLFSGLKDISDSARERDEKSNQKVKQTFLASEYLSNISSIDENIIKDHIYLEGDTWIKLFFMRGYKYPLSRSFLMRYEDPANERETCTRDMIVIPDSDIGKECFEKNNVHFVMLNNGKDNNQFIKSPNYNKIYSSEHVLIFSRIQE